MSQMDKWPQANRQDEIDRLQKYCRSITKIDEKRGVKKSFPDRAVLSHIAVAGLRLSARRQ